MKFSNLFFLAAVLVTSLVARADIDCSGALTKDSTTVTVHITNAGKIGATQSGIVHIALAGGGVQDYMILRDDISQYFEGERGGDQVMVGLEAYVMLNNPVSISYIGTNYDAVPLLTSLNDPNRVKQTGNRMMVWRGPGFKSNDQFYFEDVVCSVVFNP